MGNRDYNVGVITSWARVRVMRVRGHRALSAVGMPVCAPGHYTSIPPPPECDE
jgi:hypothetical protein